MPTPLLITALGALFTLGLSQSTLTLPNGLPAITLIATLTFLTQWIAFIPAFLKQTERHYDLTGSLTYITCTLSALSLTDTHHPRALLLTALTTLWAARLGSFLFKRVHQDGGDGRFDNIKPHLSAFLTAWTLQALWILVTASAAWSAILSTTPAPLGWGDSVGGVIWAAGLTIEVVADHQKRAWRARHGAGAFVRAGLWRYSQHPNYFGEITLWIGVALLALPALSGWAHLSLLSPVCVYLLLTRISGIPLLEARGRARWGHDPAYQDYLKRTSRLILWKEKT